MKTFKPNSPKELIRAQREFITQYPDCEISKTNYTVKMKAGKVVHFYTNKMLSNRSFSAYKKLEKSILESGIELPEVDRDNISYFNFNKNLVYPEKLNIVDMNAAYPTAIKNMGYINGETLSFLLKLPKKERLQVTGMLATQKVTYLIQQGKHVDTDIKINPLKDVFFAACQDVGDLLFKVYEQFSPGSFWYWVDGIACRPEISKHIAEFMASENFPCKIEPIENCRVKKNCITFDKEGKRKLLYFPNQKKVVNKQVLEFLNHESKQGSNN